MMYREIMAVRSEIHTKHTNTLCGQNVELLNVKLAVHIVTAINIHHAVGLYWVSGHAGVGGNEISDNLSRNGSVERFVGPEPLLGFSR